MHPRPINSSSRFSQLYEPELRKKRNKVKRRPDEELIKEHVCPFEGCHKSYASELSLSFHMREKHNAGTKTQRIAYLVSYLPPRTIFGQPNAWVENLPKPTSTSPPNSLR
jgi:hypothetical protein